MNPSVKLPQPVYMYNTNLRSCMCNEQWIFYNDFSALGQIEKSLKV